MVRFLLDKFRTMPGPLRQARIVAADLAVEVLEVARHYLGWNDEQGCGDPTPPGAPPCGKPAPAAEQTTPPPTAVHPPAPSTKAAPDPGKPRKKKSPKAPATELEPPETLAAAVDVPSNLRRQDFKILAILWDAGLRDLKPMSAKGISQHGAKLGIGIRHENVRKVIRSKLEAYVEVHTEVVGNGTVYRYGISSQGKEHFEKTFL